MAKSIKRNVIVSALLSICLCISLIAGATFAIFTSQSSVNIAVTSGKVKVEAAISELEAHSPKTIALDGTVVDDFNTATKAETEEWTFGNGGTAFYDAENNELKLDKLTPGDKVTFKITVKNLSNVKAKYRTRVICDEDTGLFDKLNIVIGTYTGRGVSEWADLLSEEQELPCLVELPGEATVQDMSCTISFIVEAVQGNAETKNDTAYYSLEEFNGLTEIPEGKTKIYVSLGNASLEGGLTIGNSNIADHYNYTNWNDNTAPSGYPHYTGRTNTRNTDNAVRYLYSTGKTAVNIILTGSVAGAKDTGGFNAGTVVLKVPDAASVTFEKVTFGAGQMAMGVWTESFQSTVVNHRLTKVTFNGCIFNGNWIQNGAFGADEMVINGSVFNLYENTVSKNNSNPVWIQNMGQTNVTIEGCVINAVRPIKLWEGIANGTVSIKNNKFVLSNFADAAGDDAYKNVAVMFCGGNLGNVEITENTVLGNATGFVCFYDNTTHYPTMNDGTTFRLYNNTLNGTKESVLWKSSTAWKPDYVTE